VSQKRGVSFRTRGALVGSIIGTVFAWRGIVFSRRSGASPPHLLSTTSTTASLILWTVVILTFFSVVSSAMRFLLLLFLLMMLMTRLQLLRSKWISFVYYCSNVSIVLISWVRVFTVIV